MRDKRVREKEWGLVGMYPPSTEQKSEASSLPLRNSADAAEALSLGHANVKTIRQPFQNRSVCDGPTLSVSNFHNHYMFAFKPETSTSG